MAKKPRPAYQHTPTGTWRLPLTKGYEAILDEQDALWAQQWCWSASAGRRDSRVYAVRSGPQYLHRSILETDLEVDHKNGNGLDNRRANLREATTSQNHCNTKVRDDNTSGFKGVLWNKQVGKWMARCQLHGKVKYLGCFDDILDAHKAYTAAAERLHGEYVGETIKGRTATGEGQAD